MNDTEQKLFDLQCIEAHTNQELRDQCERILHELKERYIDTHILDPEYQKLGDWLHETFTEDAIYNKNTVDRGDGTLIQYWYE